MNAFNVPRAALGPWPTMCCLTTLFHAAVGYHSPAPCSCQAPTLEAPCLGPPDLSCSCPVLSATLIIILLHSDPQPWNCCSRVDPGWRTRKASGEIQSESKGLRTQKVSDVSPSQRSDDQETNDVSFCLGQRPKNQEGEDGCPSSAKKSKFTLLPSFCSIHAFNRLDDAPHSGEGDLVFSVYH